MNNVKLFQAHKNNDPLSVSLGDTTQSSDDHLSFNISCNFRNVRSTFSHYYTHADDILICRSYQRLKGDSFNHIYYVYRHKKVTPTLIVLYTLLLFEAWYKHFYLVQNA